VIKSRAVLKNYLQFTTALPIQPAREIKNENLFCFDYNCVKNNNIEVINIIKENMTEKDKNEINEINKFMNNMSDEDKKKISKISQALFSSFEL
jgi:hypothetical protein